MLGLRTVIYKVDELEKAKKWYSQAFSKQPYFDEPFYVGFNIGGYELGLMPEEKNDIGKTGNVMAYWGVNDVDEEYSRLISMGATDHEKPENVGGEIIVAAVRDPWGNVLGLIYNPDFKPDIIS